MKRLLLTLFILQTIVQFAHPLQFKLVQPDEKNEEYNYPHDYNDDEYEYEYVYEDEDEDKNYTPEVKTSVHQVKYSDQCPHYSKSSATKCDKEKNIKCISNDDCYDDEICCTVECKRKCIPKKSNKNSHVDSKLKDKYSNSKNNEDNVSKSTYSSQNSRSMNRRTKGKKMRNGNGKHYGKVRNYDDYDNSHALSKGYNNYNNQNSFDYGFDYGSQRMGLAGQRNGYGGHGMGLAGQGNGYGNQRMGLAGQRNGYGGMNRGNGYGQMAIKKNKKYGNNYPNMLSNTGNQSPGFGYGNGMHHSGYYNVNNNLATTHPLLDRLNKKLSHTKPGSVYKDPTFQRFHSNFY